MRKVEEFVAASQMAEYERNGADPLQIPLH